MIEKCELKNQFTRNLNASRETLLSIKNEQQDEITQILNQRTIEHLVHFTRLENLSSILKNGLIPLSLQRIKNINSIRNDNQRIDSQFDCTSLSIEFPNYKLFYKFREYNKGSKWVVLLLNTQIILSPENIAYFFPSNASGMPIIIKERLCTARALKFMFEDNHCNGRHIRRSDLQLCDNITTNPQAEILISDEISTNYIQSIHFFHESEIVEYIRHNGHDLLNKYNHQVSPELFQPRHDFMLWQK